MVQIPICNFKTLYDMLGACTEITLIRINDGKELYKGEVVDALIGLKKALCDYNSLVVAYNGIYNNRSAGTLEIEVWDLTILEDPDL